MIKYSNLINDFERNNDWFSNIETNKQKIYVTIVEVSGEICNRFKEIDYISLLLNINILQENITVDKNFQNRCVENHNLDLK